MGLSEISFTLNLTTENTISLEFRLSAFDIYEITLPHYEGNISWVYLFQKFEFESNIRNAYIDILNL